MATIICEMTSGGVIRAARMKHNTMDTDLPLTSHFDFNKPNLVKIADTTGISKTMPKIIYTVKIKDR